MIDVLGVDDGGVAVVVLGAFGLADAGFEVGHRNDRHHRHHLLFLDERMVGIGLSEEKLGAGGDVSSGVLGEDAWIGTDESAVDGGVRATTAFAGLERERGGGEALELLRVDAGGTRLGEFLTEFIEHGSDDEDDLFTDAKQVIIERAAFDDVAGRAGKVGGGIDDDDGISRTGADCALAGFHRRVDDRRAAGDGEQVDERIFAEQIEGLDARRLDSGDDVINSDLAEDRFVVGAHGHGGAAGPTGMRIEDDGISGGHHVDDIAGESGDRVSDWQNRADDTEGRVFLEGDATIAAHRVRLEPLGAGDVFGDLELGDLVVDAADLGLLHLEAAPWLGVCDGHAFDDFDHLGATRDAEFFQLEVGVGGGVGGFVNAGENPALAGLTTATAAAGG